MNTRFEEPDIPLPPNFTVHRRPSYERLFPSHSRVRAYESEIAALKKRISDLEHELMAARRGVP